MAWSKRAPERVYAIVMWIVSLALAGFLIGLGGLIIGDLPRVEDPPALASFADPERLEAIEEDEEAAASRLAALSAEIAAARDDVETERGNYEAAYATFQNWLSTRRVTTDPEQDPEVIARTNNLDILKTRERETERRLQELLALERVVRQRLAAIETRRLEALDAARPAYERAQAGRELRVFLFRLALTLPLLAVAFWLTARKRQSRYWPLMRGFVVFALFAFFVELVPYLPSYGGYVRYGVGVLLTLLAGHYVIKWMRRYLESRRDAERQSEDKRRRSLAYEDALKKIAEKICPGCDRKVMTTGEAVADYCVHCGMHLYDRCPSCETRKVSFFRYCMVCGAPGMQEAKAPEPA